MATDISEGYCAMNQFSRKVAPWAILAAVVLFAGGCFSFHKARPASSSPVVAADQVTSPEPSEVTPETAPNTGEESVRGLMARAVFADDQQARLTLLRELCLRQVALLKAAPHTAMESAARSWLAEFIEPKNERSRQKTALGPRAGVEDLFHSPGYEMYVETGGGLLLFSREGALLGKVGESNLPVADLAFHDVDGDGQAEIFLKFDSGTNSGNRYTRIEAYKELAGSIEPVLSRKLYETAYRWVPAGLGSRISVVRLAGSSYVVIDPEGESEFLKWDEGRAAFVRESGPPKRAFLE